MGTRFGRYELLRPLGRGGMAEVFLACQRGPAGYEKRLVIKRVLPERASDPALLRRFFEEARLHAGLSHGNLVPIFDFGRIGNDYFLALELVDGGDLARLLDVLDQRRLSPELVAYVGAELCHALAHVHRQALVHRDVTPRNVLLSRDGEVKLADFGVALDRPRRAATAGTAGYMAPEQAKGDVVDARADLYALGAVLARALGDSADGPLRAIVSRAMASAPADRFPDAGAMADALETVSLERGGSRAVAARALAELVRPHAIDLSTSVAAEAPRGPAPVATYYRDHTTAASLVDDILAPSPPRRRARWLLAAVPILVIGVTSVVFHARPRRDQGPPLPPAPPVVATAFSVPVSPAPAPVPTPVTSPPAAQLGSADVICDPWCVIAVDGVKRGDDGRLHRLRLPVGHHRLVATRLEDKLAKPVVVGTSPVTVHFTFE